MSSRELARVLIRVIGVGFLAYGAMVAGVLIGMFCVSESFDELIHAKTLAYILLPVLVAVFLIAKGGWIADRFRIGEDSRSGAASALVPGDLFRVGCALIGVVCLTQMAQPLAAIAWGFERSSSSSFVGSGRWFATGPALVEVAVNLIVGLILLIGPGRVGRWTRHTFTATLPPADAPPPA